MMPVISIIIPHLNQEKWLSKCLASIEQQSYPLADIEVLLVDNGSDRMPEAETAKFPFVKLLLEETPGPGPARNLGVKHASGDYLFFIDADCIADRDWIKEGYDALTAKNAAPIIGGDVYIDYKDPNELTHLEAYETVFAFRQREYIEKMGFSGAGNLATTPQIFKEVGDFPGLDVAEDRSWGRTALKKGFSFDFVPSMVIYHPARETAADIYAKWDRHTRHDFEEIKTESLYPLRWLIRASLVLVSAILHIPKIFRSDRLSKHSDYMGAILYLSRIRFFRVRVMLRLLFDKEHREKGVTWNR